MKFWIGVVTRDFVKRAEEGGYIQLSQGKFGPLEKMSPGDWLIYYSPKAKVEGKELCQKFTAICKVTGEHPYEEEIFPGFAPYRLAAEYLPSKEVDMEPLVKKLNFIENRKNWGFRFKFGCFKVDESAFDIIKNLMLEKDNKDS